MPFTSEVKEPRYRMKAIEAEERNRNYVEYELPYHEEVVAESTRCLQCTCEAIGYCDLRRPGSSTAQRSRRWSRSPTRAPACDRSTRTASPA